MKKERIDVMASIKMRMQAQSFETPLPNAFIDIYMPACDNPVFALVYILGFRHYIHETDITLDQMAGALRLLESDVIRAWRYWEGVGLVAIQNDSPDQFAFTFLPVADELLEQENKAQEEAQPLRVKLASQPSYSPQEIDIYMERSEEIRNLFKSAEEIFAKPLTYAELNMLLSFFEWYDLPLDVISEMLRYCVGNGKKGRNYLETVARDWSENGIRTVEGAQDYIDTHSVYAKILKAFGVAGKTPNQKQITFMKRWLYEYQMPMELILEACENTFLQTGKPKFEYAETMLKDWSVRGAKTLADVDKLNAAFQEQKKLATEKTTESRRNTASKPYKNRFINYEQRTWDYDKIEKLAQEQLNSRRDNPK